jgi:hypothetical protein
MIVIPTVVVSRLENNAIWQLKSPNCQYLYLCQLSLFQAFDENENVVKVTFSSNLPFGTIISRDIQIANNDGRIRLSSRDIIFCSVPEALINLLQEFQDPVQSLIFLLNKSHMP